MHGVVRLLDTPILPASSPEGYPKVIKSGIDEEGQNIKSPAITGPCGIATLLHRIRRQQLLERLLDVSGTEHFELIVHTNYSFMKGIYVRRQGHNVEIGFINRNGEPAQHGVRYVIDDPPANTEYPVGKWLPMSTSDLDSGWGGSDIWIRAQSAAVAKAIWFNRYHEYPDLEVTWSGISPNEETELSEWMKDRSAVLKAKKAIGTKEYERVAKHGRESIAMTEHRLAMQKYYKSLRACSAYCGEENPTLVCSKCKVTRHCGTECQKEDWKYHNTYCGTEEPTPAEYLEKSTLTSLQRLT